MNNLIEIKYSAHEICQIKFNILHPQPPTHDVKPEEPTTLTESSSVTPAPAKTRIAAKFPGPSATSTPMPKSRGTEEAMEGFARSMDIDIAPKVGNIIPL
mgnify:CR=1 FL=1